MQTSKAFVEVSRRSYCRRHHRFHYVSWRWKDSKNNADIGNGFLVSKFFEFKCNCFSGNDMNLSSKIPFSKL